MTDKDDVLTDDALDALLTKAALDAPAPSDDLMARVLADAEAMRPVPGALVARSPKNGFLDGVLLVLGGWKGAGGLVTAGLIGLWIGVSPPATLETTTAQIWDVISPDLTGGWSNYDDIL